jgi:putative membrane protein
MSKKPVVIELDASEPVPTPAEAPVVVSEASTPALEHGLRFAAGRRGFGIGKLFWAAVVGLLTFMIGVFVWDFAAEMLSRNVWLGRAALVLLGVVILALLVVAGRELATLARLRRIDGLRNEAEAVLRGGDMAQAKAFQRRLVQLYQGRVDLRWALAEVDARQGDMFDAAAVVHLNETQVMRTLDEQARGAIENAARQVATATALVPLAFADVVVALTANLRMIRQIAQIYGGRSGTFGAWRLTKAVAAHLVATGAVAIGDDLIGSVAGGGVLSKVSRRFGEGVINGALTARVGVAAMEVCRPMPFVHEDKPRVTALIKRSLTGFFGKS